MNVWKCTKVYTAFLFMGHTLWKESVEVQSKIIGIKLLNCCVKVMVELRKIGCKMRELCFRELSP